MYNIAGRQVGSHVVRQLDQVSGEALEHSCSRPIQLSVYVYRFEEHVLTYLGVAACDVDSGSARRTQCYFHGRIGCEEDTRTAHQCPKPRRGELHQVGLSRRHLQS
jgi:hypothetical protein